MDRAQAHERYKRDISVIMNETLPMVTDTFDNYRAEYERQAALGGDRETLRRLVEVTAGAAIAVHEVELAYAEMFINLLATRSRFGQQARAQQAQAQMQPRLQRSEATVTEWKHRLAELSGSQAQLRPTVE